jgi:hypothetical protein
MDVCVQVAALRRADPLPKESYCGTIKKRKKTAKVHNGCKATDRQIQAYEITMLSVCVCVYTPY